MNDFSRRGALGLGLLASAATASPSIAAATRRTAGAGAQSPPWKTGLEGQRKGDLGDGRYLNPVLAGDHPDPSILKDGEIYYKVSSSFHYYPGLVIWRSRDLVNWTPVGPTLRKPLGSVLAPDLIKHAGRYYIYFAVLNLPGKPSCEPCKPAAAPVKPVRPVLSNWAVHADAITGPWSDPVDLNISEGIDPGHVVGEDGKRYLMIDQGRLVPLSDDGLARAGEIQKVYDGWPIPKDWVIEGFALEGPKLMHRDGWIYLFSAQGGTGGPPTSHMVTVARSRSVHGPWEDCPHNPIVHTASGDEPWWSRGHATPVEGPKGDWWLIYHGYENGLRTLGRQMLLEPFEWTAQGWPKAKGGTLSAPLAKPQGGAAGPHGVALSDRFATERFGIGTSFFKPDDGYLGRAKVEQGAMTLTSQGTSPANASPLLLLAGDRSYEVSVDLDLVDRAQGGLVMFYDERYFCGVGADGKRLKFYKAGEEQPYAAPQVTIGPKLSLRLVNRENVVTWFYKTNGEDWTPYVSVEISGYNHNIADGFLSLRPALYAARRGSVIYRNLNYSGQAI